MTEETAQTDNTESAESKTVLAVAESNEQPEQQQQAESQESGQQQESNAEDVLYGDNSGKESGGPDQSAEGSESSEDKEGESDKSEEDNSEKEGEQSDSEEEGEQSEDDKPTYDFAPPEGYEVDQELKSEFQKLAESEGLTEEQAKKFWDLGMENLKKNDPNKFIQDTIEKNTKQWYQELKDDPDIGGDNLPETEYYARKAIQQFANDTVINLLDSSGLGNHPEIVRTFSQVGKQLTEGNFHQSQGSGTSDQPRKPEEILYPNQN
jgi:hypothetical protein